MKTKKRFILPYLTISLFFLLSLTNAFAPVGLASTAHAATYYVDVTNGTDPNDGLSPETAWKTISKVNSMNFNPGDSILFKRGGIWREQLNVGSSGEEGNPITFGAYGEVITGWSLYDEEKNIYVADVACEITQLFVDGKRQTLAQWPDSGEQNINAPGEWYYREGKVYLCMAEGNHPDNHLIAFAKPEINGADVITGWSIYEYNEDGVIYVANVGSEVTQLFVDGQRQTLARWPNSGWQKIDANSADKTSLYSESLTQHSDYWASATIVVRTRPWKIETRTVTANSQSEHTFTWDGDTSHSIKKDYGFYIEDKLEEIDAPGEWCYSRGKVYLQVAEGDHPYNHLIEGSVRNYNIQILKKEYVNIENISVKCAGKYGIFAYTPDYINVKNNIVSLAKETGICINVWPPGSHGHVYIKDNCISNVREKYGIAAYHGLNHGEIIGNEITNIAIDEVSPKLGIGIKASGTNLTISQNKIDRISYNGIHLGGTVFGDLIDVDISNNIISNCLLLLFDGAGIYVGGAYGGTERENILIKNNVVRDIIGNVEGTPSSQATTVAGIYLDDYSSNIIVQGNIVFNSKLGIFLHDVFDNTIIDNVCYNNYITAVYLSETSEVNYMHGNNFYNNIFFAKNEEQLTFKEQSWVGSTDLMGEYNNNIHYNPYRKDVIKKGGQLYTLEEWRTVSDQDEYSIAADPLFVDASNHDFHLQPFSPCIDKGTDVGLTEDFEGNPVDSAPDIGAYEYEVTDYNGRPMPPTNLTILKK